MDADEPTPRTPLLPAALAGDAGHSTAATAAAAQGEVNPISKVGRRFDLLDTVVPPVLIGYILTAYWAVCTLAAPQLGRWRLPYLVAANTLLPTLLYTFLSVYLLPASSAAPPREPPQAVADKTAVFVCADGTGAIPRCYRDGCGGSWKPGRCRHCSICRTCQVGFDHHCPWFGTCITSSSYLKFILFLALVPVSVGVLSPPFIRPGIRHFQRVWRFARAPESLIQQTWFEWKWSWILGFGPFGRIGVGIVMGYWKFLGELSWLERGWLTLLPVFGAIFSLVAIPLACVTLRSILFSVTPIESRIQAAYRRVDPRLRTTYLASPSTNDGTKPLIADPRVWIWIPSSAEDGTGVALRTRVEEKPFDLGWAGNTRAALEDGWSAWTLLPWSQPDVRRQPPRLNPAVLQRLTYEASLLALEDKSSSEEESDGGSDLQDEGSDEAG